MYTVLVQSFCSVAPQSGVFVDKKITDPLIAFVQFVENMYLDISAPGQCIISLLTVTYGTV